ncbi:MetQ/NlpA family ABC transporter substrate-binding protein [Corynebacterium mendelii]|uniref:Methionine ABC transporter substrate-binding protein n=1 Tax=Corynebacterium mendelii TaxID=2765362 RepID=A0A939E1H0_9CORY|nr:MetQ/NlpA family ABC transporter substrate-binding protein [Corynebacterium mendelii]MBN9644073.1 methionine ABC transporter substrate-binding protein [Corynebacterium mendelii]
MKLRQLAAAAAATVIAATSLVACSGSDSSDSATGGAEKVTIKIGTTDGSKSAWNVFQQEVEKQGIDLEVVNFSDYTTPNKALSEGQIDTNLFQHLKFLSEYNVGTNDNLVPVGATEIVPLALYWKDHDSLDGIEGQSVVIPSDSSNQGRAINVLKQVGLVTLKQDDLLTPNPSDIDPATSKVTVTPVEAAQTPAAYGEGRPAIINNTFLGRANIDPKSAVAADDPSSPEAEPYINAFVTTPDRADDPNILKLVEIWHSDPVQKANDEDSKGTSVPVTGDRDKLQPILDRLEEKLTAAK